jgi:hypothetical protein
LFYHPLHHPGHARPRHPALNRCRQARCRPRPRVLVHLPVQPQKPTSMRMIFWQLQASPMYDTWDDLAAPKAIPTRNYICHKTLNLCLWSGSANLWLGSRQNTSKRFWISLCTSLKRIADLNEKSSAWTEQADWLSSKKDTHLCNCKTPLPPAPLATRAREHSPTRQSSPTRPASMRINQGGRCAAVSLRAQWI